MCCNPVLPMIRDVIASPDRWQVCLSSTDSAVAGTQTVLLVEPCPALALSLTCRLRSMGIDIVWTANMGEVLRDHLGCFCDLLMVNVDRTDEPSWLRAAECQRMHPRVPIWVYTSWSSTVDTALVEFVSAEQLIYYDGTVGNLEDRIISRLALHEGGNSMVKAPHWQAGHQAAVA